MKLFNKVAAIAVGVVLATGVGAGVVLGSREYAKAEAADLLDYTLTPATTGKNAYASTDGEVEIDGVTWNVEGNGTTNPWRLGGKSLSNVDRRVYSKDAVSSRNISKVVLTVGTASSITVNSLNLKVGTAAGGSQTSTVSGTFAASSDITFNRPNGADWSSKYFTFTFNVSVSGTSNKFVEFASAKFYYEATTTYTVSFNGNGGTGSMSNVTGVSGSYTLPANGFTAPANKAFSGWKAGNAGDLIAAGGSYNVGANVTFYAQWVDAYTVTYTAGTNGSGSYAHTLQPAGTYELLSFANLTGVSASSGYKFKNYTVGGVAKNPGDTITLSAATEVTVNFEIKPEETTYVFADNFTTYASGWTTTYGEKTLQGTTDVGGDYSSTIVLTRANKQSDGVGSNKPFLAAQKSTTQSPILVFTLTETGKKIKNVIVTFEQRGTAAPTFNLYKGNSCSGDILDSATIGTNNTVETSDLNDVSFSLDLVATNQSNNVGAGLTSIYISIENQASYGTTDHITVTSFPNTIYHIGEAYDATDLTVTAYDGADEATASFKDVTNDVVTGFRSGYIFQDADVPTTEMFVEYKESGTTFAADPIVMHVYALEEYELVTEAPDDWSGNYLIVSTNSSDELVAMNGALTTLDVEGNHKESPEKSTGIIETGQELEFTIASFSTGYSIQGKNGKYIGWSSGSNNGLTASDTPLVNTLSYDDGVVISGSGGRQLNFNTDGNGRFRYYASGVVQLYKLAESDDAEIFAQTFLGAFTCNASGTSQPTFTLKEAPSTYWSWSLLATEYNTLTAAEKEEFRLGVASESGTNIQKALARYDYVVGKYNKGQGITSYTDFMNRNPAKIGASRAINLVDGEAGTAAAMVVVVMSAISVTAVGGFFLLKKKPF